MNPNYTQDEMGLIMLMKPEGWEIAGVSGRWYDTTQPPEWDWSCINYRPAAPDGYEHTGEFRIGQVGECCIDFHGEAFDIHSIDTGSRHWIIRKVDQSEPPNPYIHRIERIEAMLDELKEEMGNES